MMRRFPVYYRFVVVAFVAVTCNKARAEIVVDHQPFPTGGPASDTDLLIEGQPFWQQNADDFTLAEPSTIRHITWWGFYGSSFTSPAEQPPDTQTMRIRFYEARPSDGLPGNVIHEETFGDPMFVATGRQVLTGAFPDEYKFDVDLASPVSLFASTPYWLEIVQVGNQASLYRWEISVTGQDGYAFRNPITVDWQHTVNTPANLAFQLSTVPEPSSGALFVIVALTFWGRGGRRSSRRVCWKHRIGKPPPSSRAHRNS